MANPTNKINSPKIHEQDSVFFGFENLGSLIATTGESVEEIAQKIFSDLSQSPPNIPTDRPLALPTPSPWPDVDWFSEDPNGNRDLLSSNSFDPIGMHLGDFLPSSFFVPFSNSNPSSLGPSIEMSRSTNTGPNQSARSLSEREIYGGDALTLAERNERDRQLTAFKKRKKSVSKKIPAKTSGIDGKADAPSPRSESQQNAQPHPELPPSQSEKQNQTVPQQEGSFPSASPFGTTGNSTSSSSAKKSEPSIPKKKKRKMGRIEKNHANLLKENEFLVSQIKSLQSANNLQQSQITSLQETDRLQQTEIRQLQLRNDKLVSENLFLNAATAGLQLEISDLKARLQTFENQ